MLNEVKKFRPLEDRLNVTKTLTEQSNWPISWHCDCSQKGVFSWYSQYFWYWKLFLLFHRCSDNFKQYILVSKIKPHISVPHYLDPQNCIQHWYVLLIQSCLIECSFWTNYLNWKYYIVVQLQILLNFICFLSLKEFSIIFPLKVAKTWEGREMSLHCKTYFKIEHKSSWHPGIAGYISWAWSTVIIVVW